jgi:hypothetical protein
LMSLVRLVPSPKVPSARNVLFRSFPTNKAKYPFVLSCELSARMPRQIAQLANWEPVGWLIVWPLVADQSAGHRLGAGGD